jgi:hypothetical protein
LQKSTRDVEDGTKVESGDTFETGFDIVVKSHNSVTDTASHSETKGNLVDDVAAGGETRVSGSGGGATRNGHNGGSFFEHGNGNGGGGGGDLGVFGAADCDLGCRGESQLLEPVVNVPFLVGEIKHRQALQALFWVSNLSLFVGVV